MGEQQRALPEVVDRECGHHQRIPCDLDRAAAEVAHVGIQGLAAGDAQHHGTERHEGDKRLAGDEAQGKQGVDGTQDVGMSGDLHCAHDRDHDEPQHHHGPKQSPDAGRAVLLHQKQPQQDHQRERNHPGLEGVRDHLQPLDRREHRDGRGDDPVAVEQAGPEDAQQQQQVACARAVMHRLGGQGQQGHEAAFAVVVGTQHQRHVLERDDEGERPEEERQYPVHIGRSGADLPHVEYRLDGIQHTGADVAVDHADGAQDGGAHGRLCVVMVLHACATHRRRGRSARTVQARRQRRMARSSPAAQGQQVTCTHFRQAGNGQGGDRSRP